MASTYSPSLRLELMATGDQSGTWGDTTNTNLGTLLEQAITGYLSKAMADANQTLTNLNGASDEARNMIVEATGALTAGRNIVVPTAEKLYLIKNSTTGGFAVTVKTSAGTGVAVPMGGAIWVYCDGTNVVSGNNYTDGLTSGAVFTDAGATVGPIYDLFRDSSSPAVNDILGRLIFNSRDSAGNKQEYGSIEAVVVSPTSTSEASVMDFYTQKGGARVLGLSIAGPVANSPSFAAGYTTTVTAAGTTTLTVSSSQQQYFTGSTTQTVVLPVTSTLVLGQSYKIVNNSTGTVTVQSSGANTILSMAGGASAEFVVILTSGTSAASWDYRPIGPTLGTVVASTSGTSKDYTIPSWAKRVTIMLSAVSTNGTSLPIVQLGTGGTPETSGYAGALSVLTTVADTTNYSTGFIFGSSSVSNVYHGTIAVDLLDPATNKWVAAINMGYSNGAAAAVGGGSKALAGLLNLVRITTVNGTDAFDAGAINVSWE